jgi:phosphate transport system substrate-binding protein
MYAPQSKRLINGLFAGMLISSSVIAVARDKLEIVGSSTVYPFATVVAERYGRASGKSTPKIESTGSGGGMKLFCSGLGTGHPDITNSSRRMKRSEWENCQANGVTDIVEVLIGYDGIVLANSHMAEPMQLTRRDIFLALASRVPGTVEGELIPNPNRTWRDVNSRLPATFAELALEGGCNTFAWIKSLKKSDSARYKSICHTVREDGHYIESGENDNLIVQKLEANPASLGVFGFSFLDQNEDKVQGSPMEGVPPTFESIADKSYPISRPLYFYVKKAHVGVVPGMEDFLAEFVSEKAWGMDGYLADKGMIPLGDEQRKRFGEAVRKLIIMSGDEFL